MLRDSLRVSRVEGNGTTGDRSSVISVSLRKETPQGAQVIDRLGSLLLGCSLLYPHSRLVLDLAQAPLDDPEFLQALERHRSKVEARGVSLRVELPTTARSSF